MEPLIRKEAEDTPGVSFNADEGVLELSGKSLPEDVKEFYNPVLEWIDNYSKNPKSKTTVNFRMKYFNTASSKMILDLIDKIVTNIQESKNELEINWYYIEADEEMGEAGEDLADMVEFPFNIIPL